MNIPTYTYDDSHVHTADYGGTSRFIDTSGAYTGTITYARAVQSSKGGWGVEFGFEADDGRKPKYPLTLWTLGPTGERYFGHDILEAVLICAGMKPGMAMKPGLVKYPRWDYDMRQEVEEEGDGYPGMSGKRVGLILQRELYTTKAGKEGSRLSIVGAFDPETRQAASEKIENKPAALLEKRLAMLKDKDSRNADTLAQNTPNSAPQPESGAFADMTDDIPF
ncbi:MAG: hypothetical protein N2690_01120 [Rhodocyclaceae bacterium]|nr:hypothetical protein [Rhodocyclaceae bacterium]